MEVILLEKINNLGNLGDKVTVKPGYGRNFLIPGGRALPATKTNVAEFEARRAELEKAETDRFAAAEARQAALNGTSVTIARKAGDEGKLFGSVGTAEISEAVKAVGIEIDKAEVRLPDGAFRATGEYEVGVHLHSDVDATIQVVVVAE